MLRDLRQAIVIMKLPDPVTLMDLKDSQDIIASWIFDKIPLFLFSFALPCRREKKK